MHGLRVTHYKRPHWTTRQRAARCCLLKDLSARGNSAARTNTVTDTPRSAKRFRPTARGGEFAQIGDIMRQMPGMAPPSAHQRRLIQAAAQIAAGGDDREIAYHYSVFCQTVLPYRRVEDRVWKSTNGSVSLSIKAGRAFNPETQKWADLPLPFGPKARLILIYLDTQATLHNNPVVELGSMTSFIAKLQGRNPNGAELRKFNEQLAAIAGAQFHLAASKGDDTLGRGGKIVSGFGSWYPKDERQRVLFPSSVRLSDSYFSSLRIHGVPLDHRAIAAMQRNALMLDIYKWLAQRLCRVPPKHPAFLVWPKVKSLFGGSYKRIRDFRDAFRKALKVVLTQYSGAQVDADEGGVRLYRSRPPILPKG